MVSTLRWPGRRRRTHPCASSVQDRWFRQVQAAALSRSPSYAWPRLARSSGSTARQGHGAAGSVLGSVRPTWKLSGSSWAPMNSSHVCCARKAAGMNGHRPCRKRPWYRALGPLKSWRERRCPARAGFRLTSSRRGQVKLTGPAARGRPRDISAADQPRAARRTARCSSAAGNCDQRSSGWSPQTEPRDAMSASA